MAQIKEWLERGAVFGHRDSGAASITIGKHGRSGEFTGARIPCSDLLHQDLSVEDGYVYRYRLWRVWDSSLKRVCFVMLNPSTANHDIEDPTITKCIAYARKWGFGSVEIVNLFAWRATNPKELPLVDEPIGPNNDVQIRAAADRADMVIAAWGAHGSLNDRARDVLGSSIREYRPGGSHPDFAPLMGHSVHVLRVSETTGHPWHPLYLPLDLQPTMVYGRTLGDGIRAGATAPRKRASK